MWLALQLRLRLDVNGLTLIIALPLLPRVLCRRVSRLLLRLLRRRGVRILRSGTGHVARECCHGLDAGWCRHERHCLRQCYRRHMGLRIPVSLHRGLERKVGVGVRRRLRRRHILLLLLPIAKGRSTSLILPSFVILLAASWHSCVVLISATTVTLTTASSWTSTKVVSTTAQATSPPPTGITSSSPLTASLTACLTASLTTSLAGIRRLTIAGSSRRRWRRRRELERRHRDGS